MENHGFIAKIVGSTQHFHGKVWICANWLSGETIFKQSMANLGYPGKIKLASTILLYGHKMLKIYISVYSLIFPQLIYSLKTNWIFLSHLSLPGSTHPRLKNMQPPLSGIGEVVAAFGDYKTCGSVDGAQQNARYGDFQQWVYHRAFTTHELDNVWNDVWKDASM